RRLPRPRHPRGAPLRTRLLQPVRRGLGTPVRAMRRTAACWRLLMLSALPAGAIGIAAGCAHGSAPVASPPAPAAILPSRARHVGSDACAECHPKEFRSHQATGHAHSMRLVGADVLAGKPPPTGPIPGSHLEVRTRDFAYTMASRETGSYYPLEY